jgi:DNA adenine methylase
MSNIKRPALRYYGGKWKVANRIIKMFPAHTIYVEPFGGGANILLRKERVFSEIYNDINSDVYMFFKVLRDYPTALISKILLTPISREEFEQSLQDDGNDDQIEFTRKFFVRSWLSIVGIGGRNVGKSSFRRYRLNNNDHLVPNEGDLYAVAGRLVGVLIEHLDFEKCIDIYDSDKTLFYIDPPYYGDCGNYYTNTITENDHIRLAKKLEGIKGYACISGIQSDLYDELYKCWEVIEFPVANTNHGVKIEKLWMNYTFEDGDV